MREEEKITKGHLFDPTNEELVQIKHKAHELSREYNTLDEYDERRDEIIRDMIADIGDGFYFQGPLQFNYGSHTHIGKNFFANSGLTVLDDNHVYIGDDVALGPNVSIMAANHPLISTERMGTNVKGEYAFAEFADPIHIGSGVWIGSDVVITGGVTIGDNAVIGAGSVVVRDIPADTLAFGSPCRPIRKITAEDSQKDRICPGDEDHFDIHR